jgi:GEVED domain/PKD domain
MKKLFYALMLLAFFANTASAQYCSPTFTNGCFSWRNQNIVVGSINWALGSTSCNTSDYTGLSTTVTAGETLPMTVTNGNWCGAGVWVDFNSDFAFDDSENLYHSYQGASTATYNFNITIPANVAAGSYRMRVIAGWGTDTFDSASTNGHGACGSYQYGSFQDFTLQVVAPQLCGSAGNVIIYANYDGGAMTINVDQDIPDLRIGVCTYEDCAITITGPYASNVTEVVYAGFQGNNDNCGTGITSTVINAPAGTSTSVLLAPASILPDANGYGSMICAYSCSAGSQGGCNTAQQVVAYFLNQFGGSLYYYFTQYDCWAGATLSVSEGGNCCPEVQLTGPVALIDVSNTQVCVGDCIVVNDASTGEPTSWNWQLDGTTGPATAQNPGEVCYDQPGSYSITLTASNAQGSSTASATIEVTACEVPGCMYPNASNYNPNATVDNLSCLFPCAATDCPADLDTNGFVGVSDLLLFIADYGSTCPN